MIHCICAAEHDLRLTHLTAYTPDALRLAQRMDQSCNMRHQEAHGVYANLQTREIPHGDNELHVCLHQIQLFSP